MMNITTPIDENNYAEIMNSTVEPFLEKIKKDGMFISFDGKRIHYEEYTVDSPKANIVISHGFTESAEKFREMSYYFVNNGYNVFAIDHRGHGSSYRIPGDTEVVKINKFSDYIEDFRIFIDDIVKKDSVDKPIYLYAHSMGGAVAIMYLEKYGFNTIEKAVLSSPMLCPNLGIPKELGKTVISAACAFGKGNDIAIGRTRFNPNRKYTDSDDTSEARFEYYNNKRIKYPSLRTTAPSYNWVKESLAITKSMLDSRNCDWIKTNILLFQPEQDRQVILKYQDEFVSKVATAQLVKIPNSKHEIFYSTNDVLENYLKQIFDFLE